MRLKPCLLISSLTAFLAIAAWITPAIAEAPDTLIGELTVHERDDAGDPISLYLADTDEGDVLLVPGGALSDLLSHVGTSIQAWGTLEETDDDEFDLVLRVAGFSPVEDEGE